MSPEEIIRKNKEKRKQYCYDSSSKTSDLNPKLKYVKNLISRTLVAVIFVLASIIFTNISDKNKELYKSYVLENSLEFTKINNWYQKFLGSVDITKKGSNSTSTVFNNIKYSNIEKYKDSTKMTVGLNEAINVITSGIIVFIGEKEDLGNTIIVQGNDGVDIWYSNITDTDLKVYDYIEKGSILGTSNSDYIYVTIYKDGAILGYEEYQKLI